MATDWGAFWGEMNRRQQEYLTVLYRRDKNAEEYHRQVPISFLLQTLQSVAPEVAGVVSGAERIAQGDDAGDGEHEPERERQT